MMDDSLWGHLEPVTASGFVTCPVCGKQALVDDDGKVKAHDAVVSLGEGKGTAVVSCPGKGQRPAGKTGAASKRPSLADAPTKQPMKAGIKPAQQKALSGDQKKHRRQMSKKAEIGPGEDLTTCPLCGATGIPGEGFTDLSDLYARGHDALRCDACGHTFDAYTGVEVDNLGPYIGSSSTNQQDTTKESTMTTSPNGQPTEADLLTRMAAATTLTEQAALGAQLDALRASQREAAMVEGSLDWSAMDAPFTPGGISTFATLSPVADRSADLFTEHLGNHRTSSASDWLMDVVPDAVDDQQMATAMRAQAVGWYQNEVWAPVKDSREEFSVQAHNAAARVASAYGTQRTAAASVFLDQINHLYRKDKGMTIEAAWGDNDYPKHDTTIDTYVSDGKDSLPVGVDPAKAETFDEHTLPGADGNEGSDPKSNTTTGQAPSLQEGSTPEGDHSEGSENPLTGDTSVDKSTFDVGNTEDKMKTQGSLNMFEALMAPYTASAPGQPLTHTADAQSSEWGLGAGIDEGDTPEGDHAESPVQNNGEGAKDMSDATDSDRPGGGVNWGTGGGAAQDQTGAFTASAEAAFFNHPAETFNVGDKVRGRHDSNAGGGTVTGIEDDGRIRYRSDADDYTKGEESVEDAKHLTHAALASLSPNAQVFVQTLSTMASLDEERAGVSGHQIVAFLAADPTVPQNVREALKAGGNPFVREGEYARNPQGNPDLGWVDPKKVSPDEAEKQRLFPNGIPLRGDLTPEQQAWLKRRSSLSTEAAMPDVTQLMAWENGDLDADAEVSLFQSLIDSGLAWSLQGMYGRRAMELINAGTCHAAKTSAVYEQELWRPSNGNCSEYPEGQTDEDGADEPSCEQHRTINGRTVHQMSNGLYRVTEDGKYIDGVEDRQEALNLAREGAKTADVKSGPKSTCEHCGLKINRDATSTWVDHNGKTRCSKSDSGHRPNQRGRWASTTAAESDLGISSNYAQCPNHHGHWYSKSTGDCSCGSNHNRWASKENPGGHTGGMSPTMASVLASIDAQTKTATVTATCEHCGRHIIKDADGRWVDPEATGDDSVWRETCDSHDTFTAEHEPKWGTIRDTSSPDTSPSPDSGNFRPLGSLLPTGGLMSTIAANMASTLTKVADSEGPTWSKPCPRCGTTVERWRGESNVSCPNCDAQFNASGQQLRDDWASNRSNYDDEIGDMEGYEDSFHDASRRTAARSGTWHGAPATFIPTPGGLAVIVQLPEGHADLGYAPGSEFMENTNDPGIVYAD